VKQRRIILQPDVRGLPEFGDVQALAKEALIQRQQGGPGREHDHEEKGGQDQQIGQDGIAPLAPDRGRGCAHGRLLEKNGGVLFGLEVIIWVRPKRVGGVLSSLSDLISAVSSKQ